MRKWWTSYMADVVGEAKKISIFKFPLQNKLPKNCRLAIKINLPKNCRVAFKIQYVPDEGHVITFLQKPEKSHK